jgi:DNA repair protein RecO (recombination protein O)
MLVRTKAVLLRKVAYTGSSYIITFFTEKYGPLAFMMRIPRGKNRNHLPLQALSMLELSFNYRESRDVQNCSQAETLRTSALAYADPLKATIAIFLAEMLYKSLRAESPDPDLFQYVDQSLDFFERSEEYLDFHCIFLLRLTRFFGFYPAETGRHEEPYFDLLNGEFVSNPSASLHTLNKEESDIFRKVLSMDDYGISHLRNEERRKLLNRIVEYYQLHFEGFGQVKSLPVLREVFSS